jgi:hypothetical protein
LHLQAMGQLFTIAEKRSQRYQDSFSIRNVTNRHPTDPGWRAAAPHPAHNNQP